MAAAKGKFHRARVEAVVLHPANDGLNEILQRGREAARGELVLVAGAKQSFAKFVGDLPGDSPDPRARLLRREVAPALAFLLQLLMGAVGSVSRVEGGVAVWAHVGGFVAGMALIKLFANRDYLERRRGGVVILPRDA